MLKMAKEAEPKLDDEPRSVRDPVMYNRLRVMIEEEAIKPTWGCPLYIAARKGGWLTEDQRRAGDKYQQICIDYYRIQDYDPNEAIPEGRELMFARAARYKRKWKDATKVLLGCRETVDKFVLREECLITPKERRVATVGLQLLHHHFSGNKT